MSTGQLPTDFKVNVCAAEVFVARLPKARPVALVLIVDTTACRLKLEVAETPAAVAVNFAVCEEPTADIAAVNPALLAPDPTVTVAGTLTAALLLDRLTASPPLGAGAFRVTLHGSLTIPLTDALVHEMELRAAAFPV